MTKLSHLAQIVTMNIDNLLWAVAHQWISVYFAIARVQCTLASVLCDTPFCFLDAHTIGTKV